jgi:hypothetical protein
MMDVPLKSVLSGMVPLETARHLDVGTESLPLFEIPPYLEKALLR